MLKVNFNEMAALQFILEFVSVNELVTAAMNGFSENEDIASKENADICFKTLQAYLK